MRSTSHIETLTPNLVELGNTDFFSPINPLLIQTDSHLVDNHTIYYRSKIFTSNNGINLLAAAASPIFSIIEKLKYAEIAPDSAQLKENLLHEIKAFEHKAQTGSYHSQVILAARYVLCAWADEMIHQMAWSHDCGWEHHLLLNSFAQDHVSYSKQFFALLERCSQDPRLYLDLLELIYLCLSLGYEGDYRYLDNERHQLDKIIDRLYLCIRQQRGDLCKQLAITSTLSSNLTTSPLKQSSRLTTSAVCIATIFMLSLIYALFNFELQEQATVVYKDLTNFQQIIALF